MAVASHEVALLLPLPPMLMLLPLPPMSSLIVVVVVAVAAGVVVVAVVFVVVAVVVVAAAVVVVVVAVIVDAAAAATHVGLMEPSHWHLTKLYRKGKGGRRNHEALLRDWHRTGTIKKNFCSAHLVGKVLVPAPSLSSVPAEPQAG